MNPEIEEEGLRNYLLGNVDSARRTQLEERILSEPGVYEELLVTEADLIDQYVDGGLSELEQQRFETHFLIDVERQKNLRFSRLLKRYANFNPALVPRKISPVQITKANQLPENILFYSRDFADVLC